MTNMGFKTYGPEGYVQEVLVGRERTWRFMLGPSHHMKGPEEWPWTDPLVEVKFCASHLYHVKIYLLSVKENSTY